MSLMWAGLGRKEAELPADWFLLGLRGLDFLVMGGATSLGAGRRDGGVALGGEGVGSDLEGGRGCSAIFVFPPFCRVCRKERGEEETGEGGAGFWGGGGFGRGGGCAKGGSACKDGERGCEGRRGV